MDAESGTQKENSWEIPRSADDWLSLVAFVVIITAAIGLPIVGGVMYLWMDAPSWSLVTAVLMIAGVTTWLAIAPEVDDRPEGDDEGDTTHWVRVRPQGALGWLKFVGSIIATWIGMNCLVNIIVLDMVLGVAKSTQYKVTLGLLVFAILLETFDVVENESAAEPGPEHPDERTGLVDA